MYCISCGKEIYNNDRVCPNCGAYVPETQTQAAYAQQPYEQPSYEQPVYEQQPYARSAYLQPVGPAYDAARPMQSAAGGVTPTNILVLGIVAAALAELGIPGIILGIIAMNRSNQYVAAGGVACGQSKTGRVLGRVGLIAGIAMSVFWLFYIVFYVALFSYIY